MNAANGFFQPVRSGLSVFLLFNILLIELTNFRYKMNSF